MVGETLLKRILETSDVSSCVDVCDFDVDDAVATVVCAGGVGIGDGIIKASFVKTQVKRNV